jgi:hypothetical protein
VRSTGYPLPHFRLWVTSMSHTHPSVVGLRGKRLVDSCADKQLNAYQVSVTIIHTCTIVLTSWRLWYKIFHQCWWWEDMWAAIALAAVTTSGVSVWIFSSTPMGMSPQTCDAPRTFVNLFRLAAMGWSHYSVLASDDQLHHRSLVSCSLHLIMM